MGLTGFFRTPGAPLTAPARAMATALAPATRPAGRAVSVAQRAVSGATREGATMAARALGPVAAVADLGPSRRRRQVWSSDGRAHIEVRGLIGRGPAHHRLAAAVTSALTSRNGVRWAEVNAVTGFVVAVFDEAEAGVDALVSDVEAVEKTFGTDADDFPWTPGPHPADDAPASAATAALAADCLGIAVALTGRVARVGTAARAFRAPVALADAQPRLRRALAGQIGPLGADTLIAFGNVITHALTGGEGPLAVDAVQRILQLGEVQARQGAWKRRELEIHSGGHGLPAEAPERLPRPSALPSGPIEEVADRTTAASLLGAAGSLAWTGDPERAFDVILATVPKGARLGREGFACMVGRDLAERGVIILDASALRRLDRVSTVVIDSAALCSTRPQVLSAVSTGRRFGEGEIWQFAAGVLHGRHAGELRGAGPWSAGPWRLRRAAGAGSGASPFGPEGMTLELADSHGRCRGKVTVGLELDPLADPVLAAAREAAGKLLLTEHASVADVVSWADEVLPRTAALAGHVRRLQADGDVVLAVSADADAAVDASDVGVGVLSGARGPCWSADLICGPGLREVWRVLQATAAAPGVSQRSARLSTGGSAVGALLIAARPGTRRRRGGLTPVHSAALAALVSGAATARSVARRRDPAPMPRGAFHAMTAEDSLARLWQARQPPSVRTGPDGARPGTAGPDGPAVTGGGPAETETSPRSVWWAAAPPARSVVEFAGMVREELRDPLTPVLALGAVASAIVGSGVDAVLVGSVMAGNALVSGAERMRAERALRQLLLGEEVTARRVLPPTAAPAKGPAAASAPSVADLAHAPAESVRARDLVAGDIIRLRPSDVVPADARLLSADDLEVDEATLTGESVPVTKTAEPAPGAPLGERSCMVYEGTSVLAGTACAVVTASGAATEGGRAAAAAERAAPPAGLQARLAELTRVALPVTGLGGLAVTGIGLLRGLPLRQAMASGVSVAVAAVPEGLPLVATVSELAAARRLSARGVLVRAARALEALGRVDTVCFDKTGTLTEGRIAVVGLAVLGADIPFDSALGRRLLRVAARACPRESRGRLSHATDRAVVEAARQHVGADPSWLLVDELPFETSRGFAASFGTESGQARLAVKGAPEVVLPRCAAIIRAKTASRDGAGNGKADGGQRDDAGQPGEAVRLTPARRHRAQELVHDLAASGLRVLAVAETGRADLADEYEKADGQVADLVSELTLSGFLAFADTVRPSAEEAVRRLKEAGVRIVMITGDHPATAASIAGQVGIPEANRVLSGPEIGTLSEAARTARINSSAVFARVSPEQKAQIIRSLQRSGQVVAMTGDGTNDAAAIRLADVGIGVAARGSTSARSSADLVLTDSDPTRIANAIQEGRTLWSSARDAVSILIGGNAGEVAFMLLGTALGGRAPLNTRQLLLVNMLTDMLPALAVAIAPASKPADGSGAITSAAPGPAGSFMGEGLLRDAGVRGAATAVGALAAWQAGRMTGRAARADTMGLAGVVLTELGQTLLVNWRSPLVIATSAISAAVLVAIVETPGVSQFFRCTPLGPAGWGLAAGSAAGATALAAAVPRLLDHLAPAGGSAEFPAQRQLPA